MKDLLCDHFQDSVSELLMTQKSVLDILTKLQESQFRVNRAVIKSATSCGCIQIEAKKQSIPEDTSLQDLKNFMDTHIKGTLCEKCREVIEKELGSSMFYSAALCNVLGISMYDIILKEYETMNTLGIYNMF